MFEVAEREPGSLRGPDGIFDHPNCPAVTHLQVSWQVRKIYLICFEIRPEIRPRPSMAGRVVLA